MGTLIAAMTIGGFASGLIFVAYAGISELVPKKYRYACPIPVPFTKATKSVLTWSIVASVSVGLSSL